MSSIETQNLKERHIIVDGSPWLAIWIMSWPLLINNIIISGASSFDIYVAGRYGSASQAAIGVAGQFWYFMVLMTVALSAGTGAIVSRYMGAQSYNKAILASRQSILFALFFGLISSTVGYFCAKLIFDLVAAKSDVCLIGTNFIKVDVFTQIPFTLIWILNSILRSKGDAKTPMIAWVIMVICLFCLQYSFCIWPFKIGINGIAISWIISGFIGLLFEIIVIYNSEFKEALFIFKSFKLKRTLIWFNKILKIGLPACIQDLAWVVTNFILIRFLANSVNPNASQASWAIGLRIEEILGGMPIYALSMAVATLVGQNLGAGQIRRAIKMGYKVTFVGVALNAIVGLIMYFGAGHFAHLMTSDNSVRELVVAYFRIAAPVQVFVAIWLILYGAMQGAGYTNIPMWTNIVVIAFARLTLSYILVFKHHIQTIGVFLGVAYTACAMGLIAFLQYRFSKWYKTKV